MTPVEETVEDLADLYLAERSTRGSAKTHIQRVRDRRARSLRSGVPKAAAARLLGVSVNTLDKWIARGRIGTVTSSRSRRELVEPHHLAKLLVHVRVLRQQGSTDGVLAVAIEALERDDQTYRREFDELYGASLRALESGDVKPLQLPDSFGPED